MPPPTKPDAGQCDRAEERVLDELAALSEVFGSYRAARMMFGPARVPRPRSESRALRWWSR
jgi:hypothetical protein